MGIVTKLSPDGNTHLIASSAYGTCSTAAGTVIKEVVISNWDSTFTTPITGMTIHVKFTNNNTAANPTLKIVNTSGGSEIVEAKSIYKYGTTVPGTSVAQSWNAGSVVSFTYDGNDWQMNDWNNSTYYYESCYVTTAAGTAEKVGTLSNYALHPGHLQVAIYNTNTVASALTLNINSTGALPIYIDGVISSDENYTLSKGMYLVYCDGENYYFRTDGSITTKDLYIDDTELVTLYTSIFG